MTAIEERAPLGLLMTPTERDELAELLARVERMALDLSATLGAALEVVRADRAVHVDLGDPLAAFRLASGAVCFDTVHVDDVNEGDWVQRCHGDPDWHLVTDVEPLLEGWVRVVHDGLAHDWKGADAIRVAVSPEVAEARWDR